MSKIKKLFAVFLFLFSFAKVSFGQPNLYAEDTIQVIKITFSYPNWDYMLDTAKLGSDSYILATQVIVNGVVYDSVGVKFKGNSSYDSSQSKNPLHIKLDYVHGNASYYGRQDIKLGNGFSDPSLIREALAYKILRNYMAEPLCNFAHVTINNVYYGVFSNAESIDSGFNSNHFYSSGKAFFKCNPVNVVSGQIPNLLYLGTDSVNYYPRYEMKSAYGWNELIGLCDTLANSPNVIDTILDVDRALWMLAFNNVTVNLDSYSGAYAQNYYLYRDDNKRFVPIIWDLNMCFGGFTNTGTSNLSISGEQQMTPLLHSTYGGRPLIMNLLADSAYFKMYIAHMRTISDEFFSNGLYNLIAQNMQSLIDTSVAAELHPFYSYPQFQQGLTGNVVNIPGIANLMGTRSTFLNSTPQFQLVPPVISNVIASPVAVALNDTIWVTASVTGSSNVYLGYRDQLWKRFYRIKMFDDGLHGDGIAGDQIFGAMMIASSGLMQYYIYSDNSDAGVFSPVRAEYEFYSYQVAISTAGPGQVVINELMSNNSAFWATNASGQHSDWIELFNNSGYPLSLNGLYMTDDVTNHFKYALPDIIISGNGMQIFWADGNASSSTEFHANFHLSSSGETLMLCNNAGVVLDSIVFPSLAADESYGRCPNGFGPFMVYSSPSFNGWNICPGGVNEETSDAFSFVIYPNPASSSFTLKSSLDNGIFEIVSIEGEICKKGSFDNTSIEIDTRELASGLYLVLIKNNSGTLFGSKKLSVFH
ncbi:hypothetical protein BH09BAC5_BH09BAC5_16320 [soil metagenome]